MRALEILHGRLSDAMEFMHKARWDALWLVVQALLAGEQLWLTALGRARPGNARAKHAIKAVDRLLGNGSLHDERHLVYRGIAQQLVRPNARPVIAVDTVEICVGWYALIATLPFRGRSFPICAHVTRRVKPRGPALLRFLRVLRDVLPAGCRPILVTDAGFESPWFIAVKKMGWDFVGRLRNTTKMCVGGCWVGSHALHSRATNRASNLGWALFPQSSPQRSRLVLAKHPRSLHRRHRTRSGRIRRRELDHRFRTGSREPWLLATSMTARPSTVVSLFALRMRIEETFRDFKNHRWGWSLRHCRSRSRKRLETLLLIGAIALFVQQVVGLAAEVLGLHRGHQANTECRRRVLSIFVLGGLVLRSPDAQRIGPVPLLVALWQLSDATSDFRRHHG